MIRSRATGVKSAYGRRCTDNHDRRASASSADRPPRNLTREPSRGPLIGLHGQVTSLPDRPESLRVLAPCQIPALLALSPSALGPRTLLRSPADAGKADIARQAMHSGNYI